MCRIGGLQQFYDLRGIQGNGRKHQYGGQVYCPAEPQVASPLSNQEAPHLGAFACL